MTRTASSFFAALLALVLTMAFVGLSPLPATAHGGPIRLDVHPDGAGGIVLYAQYVRDGHMVDVSMDPLVTAAADDGRTAGPAALVVSPEGTGVWVSEQPFLEEGRWTITARISTPEPSETVAVLTVGPISAPLPTESPVASADAAAQTGTAFPGASDSSLVALGAAGLGAGVLLLGGVIAAVVLRRRHIGARG